MPAQALSISLVLASVILENINLYFKNQDLSRQYLLGPFFFLSCREVNYLHSLKILFLELKWIQLLTNYAASGVVWTWAPHLQVILCLKEGSWLAGRGQWVLPRRERPRWSWPAVPALQPSALDEGMHISLSVSR